MSESFYIGDVFIQNGSTIAIANLPASSTSGAGIVQLNDTTSSTSTSEAATANAVKAAYDLAASAGAAATPTALGTVYGLWDAPKDNLSYGLCALRSATTGSSLNSAFGSCTLCAVTSGQRNTAYGANTGKAIQTGARNTLVGAFVGGALVTSCDNTFVGATAGFANTGGCNTFIGSGAGDTTVATSCGVAIGWNALGAAHNQSGTTAVGACALLAVTTGLGNVALGFQAGDSVTTGGGNTFLGYTTGDAVTTGSNNTIIGDISGTAALADNLILAAGTTIKLQVNENGAVGVGTTPSYGTNGQILMSTGTGSAPAWTGSAALLPNYGSFLSTVPQNNLDTTNGNAVTYNTTTESRNVSIVDGTKLTVASAGTYNIQFSMQVTKTDAGSDDINIWFKKNGVNVDNSASNITLVGNNTPQLATVNFIMTLAAGDFIEIWWWSLDTDVQLLAENAVAPYPAIPSIITTVVPVGA
jgi:hypothetical protein